MGFSVSKPGTRGPRPPTPGHARAAPKYLPDHRPVFPLKPLGSPQPPPHAGAVGGHHPAARGRDASIPAASDSFITPRPEPARPIRCQVRGLPATNQSRASPPAVAFRQWEKARGPDRRGTRTPRARRRWRRRRRQQRTRREHNMAAAGRTELQQRPREGSEVAA